MKNRLERKKLKAIDFFCGAGGMTFGLSQAGIDVLAGIDNDPSCKETYEINNHGSKFIEADIHELSEEQLAELTGTEKNDESLIFIGCSPCQYWTKINTDKNKAKQTKNLLGEFQRFVAYFRPGYVVIENVPGLYTNKKENVLSNFLNFLDNERYSYDHDLIYAYLHGVPQTRKRYLLMASRVAREIRLPEKETDDSLIVRNFIGVDNGFHPIEAGTRDDTEFIHTSAALSEENKRRISMTPKDGGTRMCWKDDQELQIPAYEGKDNLFRNVYGRIFWDKPGPTITTKFHSLSNGRFGHPEEDRAISLREGATLQTFPKTYKFKYPSIITKARHIGNAVPPELAKRIGITIIRSWENAVISS